MGIKIYKDLLIHNHQTNSLFIFEEHIKIILTFRKPFFIFIDKLVIIYFDRIHFDSYVSNTEMYILYKHSIYYHLFKARFPVVCLDGI